jgi:hypothetical protein
MPVAYLPRLVDDVLTANLRALGAVLIEGVKGCGKTETALRQARSAVRLDTDRDILRAGMVDPAVLLEGETPHLIDEWQRGPDVLWDLVRRAVDDRRAKGQFILTGSATPEDSVQRHSGAGRFGFIRMRTMTLAEKGATTPSVSVRALLDGDPVSPGAVGLTLSDYLHHIVVGGWPDLIGADESSAFHYLAGYLETIVERDLPDVASGARNPQLVTRFLRAYAMASSTAKSMAKIIADTGDPSADAMIARNTATSYHAGLYRMRIIDELDAWMPSLRSPRPLTQTPKRHLADPSLAAHLLRADSTRLRRAPDAAGLLFESLAVHDLRAYAAAQAAHAYHHRTELSREEIDCVIETISGQWAGFEIKLGADTEIDEAVAKLRRIEGNMSRPAASLVVITARGFIETRTGVGKKPVHIIPLGALGA